MLTLDRRTLLAGAAGAGLLGAMPAGRSIAQTMPPAPMRFVIRVDGSESGEHTLRFVRTPAGFDAFGTTSIRVRIAFINAYRFSQNTEERWENGTWTQYRSTGAENGNGYEVQARNTPQGALLQGRPVRARDLMPASFWTPRVLDSGSVIDPVKGTVVSQSVQPRGRDSLTLGGQRVAATAYAVDNFLGGTIWYSPEGRWLAATFDRRGHAVEYIRTA
ncbi:DUF6134 family protein [Azospirillum halopraeferens]|uniref:DUF6134 family protein n=1 Tax=Azospirillum halopraeferens TaxID=34010 RepID=UPI00040DFFDD|nr:DUF6134 family protein [Azospirillum halopraeferens]